MTDAGGWRCGSCDEVHHGLAYSFAYTAPDAWFGLSWWRRRRSNLQSDTCEIDRTHFFIRGLIEIPVQGGDEPVFSWNIWTSLSRDNFHRATEHWYDPERVHEPPYFGWLSVELAPTYPTTTNLKINVHTRELGVRPYLELEPTDHPLAVEQREGITVERVRKLNELLLHRP